MVIAMPDMNDKIEELKLQYGNSLYMDYPHFIQKFAELMHIGEELYAQAQLYKEHGDMRSYNTTMKIYHTNASTQSSYYEKLVRLKNTYRVKEASEDIDELEMSQFLDVDEEE